jgi:hypothetical protein
VDGSQRMSAGHSGADLGPRPADLAHLSGWFFCAECAQAVPGGNIRVHNFRHRILRSPQHPTFSCPQESTFFTTESTISAAKTARKLVVEHKGAGCAHGLFPLFVDGLRWFSAGCIFGFAHPMRDAAPKKRAGTEFFSPPGVPKWLVPLPWYMRGYATTNALQPYAEECCEGDGRRGPIAIQELTAHVE